MNLDQETLAEYKRFVRERHRVYESRLLGKEQPWCDDEVVLKTKFTNVFRVLDHGSQFVLKELISEEAMTPVEVLVRSILYRATNRDDVWIVHKEATGEYPSPESVVDGTTRALWQERKDKGLPMMNFQAYVPGKAKEGQPQWSLALDTAKALVEGDLMDLDVFLGSDSEERMAQFTGIPLYGNFMSQQVLTDFHYSSYGAGTDHENVVVVDGPGSKRGAEILSGSKTSGNVKSLIHYLRDMWADDPEAPAVYPEQARRTPSLMDVQNTLCEFQKYRRRAGKVLPTSSYKPKHDKKLPEPVLPDHWATYR